jgi:polyisoprenoid-binding protein YceI
MKVFLYGAILALTSAFTLFALTQFKIIPENATVEFWVKEANGEEHGVFEQISGNIIFNEKKLSESKFNVSIPVTSINTGIEMRDESLRSADFFEVKKYPAIKLLGVTTTKAASGYILKAKLTIKQTTKAIEIPFTIEEKDGKTFFKGSFSINRLEYKVGTKDDGVGSQVRIALNIGCQKVS